MDDMKFLYEYDIRMVGHRFIMHVNKVKLKSRHFEGSMEYKLICKTKM